MAGAEFRANTPGARFRSLHGRLERAIRHIGQMDDVSRMLGAILELLCLEFAEELGFEGGRIYTREDSEYVLCCGFGSSHDAPLGLRVPHDYPPHQRLLADGITLMSRGDPGVDEHFEAAIGVSSSFAAIGIGEGTTHIIAFSLKGEKSREDALFSLNLVRHVLNLKLQQQRMAGIIDAARILQEGILPGETPVFGGFDIAAAFQPAELVSGDVFDYLQISDCCLGVAIADSSGHGLPAALLARDVITALRTAAGQGTRVASIVERVNAVVQRAALYGNFVTLFYGQLSSDGTLEYCNAGHEPPLLVGPRTIQRLEAGGILLGPFPKAIYESGTACLQPGDILVLYTDGIAECRNSAGVSFGPGRIERIVSELRDQPSKLVANTLLAEVHSFAGDMPAQDDMTVVVVRRPAAATAELGGKMEAPPIP